jgi:predicted TPR repeat methyltransferase
MSEDPKRVVERGYDAIADRFAHWQRGIVGMRAPGRVARLLARLPPHPEVLELGVGAGVEQSRLLAEHSRLTGVDISAEQLRRARERLPGARLVRADFTDLRLPLGSFDAVVACYVLNHVPRGELGQLLGDVAGWLRTGGFFLASFGSSETLDAVEEDWLGVPMFFAVFEPGTNRRLVLEAGLDIIEDELEPIVEPVHGQGAFHWIVARKP